MTSLLTPVLNALPLQSIGPLTSTRVLEFLAGPPSATGQTVNEQTALGVSAFYSCVRVICEGVSALPLFTFRRLSPRGRERAVDHPTYRLLSQEPNPMMTSLQLRETLQGHLCLRGNAYAEIERDGSGRPKGLWPLRPDRMGTPMQSANGSLVYPYTVPNGEQVNLPQSRVLHLRGLSSDGITGYSPLQLHRETLGLSMAATEYGARFFNQGARPGGVLQAPVKLSDDASKRMARSWNEAHQGLSNAHRIAVLEEGVTWASTGMTNEDAQYLESKSWQVAEIARLFRVPPHMIGDVERSTSWGSGIEQLTIGFVTHTLVPWLVRWEQQLHKDLFLPAEREEFYPQHIVTGLLRGDAQSRGEFYTKLKLAGILNADEIRELEDMNPIPDGGGEDYWQPVNVTVVGAEPPAPVTIGSAP